MQLSYTTHPSPIGDLLLVGDTVLRGLYIPPHRWAPRVERGWHRTKEPFAQATAQLDAYFSGESTEFNLPMAAGGTAFQQQVWAALKEIPYGQTTTYGQLAKAIGRPRASRAVGAANGRNPISIIVPCHRVIGANGRLTGYGAGVERKQALLDHERDRCLQ